MHSHLFEDPEDTPAARKVPTRAERKEAKVAEKEGLQTNVIEEEVKVWDPHNDANATGDAFKTVFISRINFDTREDKLRREFEEFGYIRKIHMVCDIKTGKPRGYAFIEYETEKGMRSAFKYGDGRKIDGRRVVVDIERGRTVKNWKPRRFGGGLGGTRIGAPEMNIAHSGRVEPRQYQDKLARAQKIRERLLNPANDEDKDRDRSRSRDKSRDRSERRSSRERPRDDDRRDDRRRGDRGDESRSERRMPRAGDDDRKRDRDRDDDRRKDRGDDRKRDRRDDDRDRDRKRDRRDRDGDRNRDRDREGDKDGDRGRDRDRDGGDRDRDIDRDRDGDRNRDRDREGDKDDAGAKKDDASTDVKVKEEPQNDGYSEFVAIKAE